MSQDPLVHTGERSGTAQLRPRARLIGLIGEDLISDEPVALVELVKNSYDADARHVSVRFGDATSGNNLVVEDDGHGMDLDTVLRAWFEPGTNSKRANDRSPGGRIYQGAKGIGRFASARLASSLLLESRVGSGGDGVTVLFDWGAFDEEAYLDQIEVAWEMSGSVDLDHGTRLTLDPLRKRWSEKEYEGLHSRLSRLISPFGEVSDFEITLDVPGYPALSGVVQAPALLAKPRYFLTGTVDDDGYFDGELKYEDAVADTFTRVKLGGADGKPGCGSFSVELRGWDRDREGLDPLVTALNQSISEIRKTLSLYSGVSIYRDGFRVYPYGQEGNDWLGLDNRSRQNPVRRLANNQIVAAIRISRDSNPDLRDRSTREGLVENSAYKELQIWFVEILNKVEEFRYGVRRPRSPTEKTGEPLFEAFDLRDAVSQARRTLGADHSVTVMLTQLEEQVSEGVERVQEVFSRLLMSAGLGQMVDIVIHEIGAPLGRINRQLIRVEQEVSSSSDPTLVATLAPMITKIKGWLEEIHNLRQRLDPQTAGKRGRATAFDVREEIDDTFRLYGALLDGQHIEARIECPDPVRVFMARSALGQVVANLVDNAIFWLRRTKGAGKGGLILTTVEKRGKGFSLTVSDDGPGVADGDRRRHLRALLHPQTEWHGSWPLHRTACDRAIRSTCLQRGRSTRWRIFRGAL